MAGGPVGTERSQAADEVVARLERLPLSRFHATSPRSWGVGTFFDAFDALTIGSALPVIFVTLHIGFVNSGISSAQDSRARSSAHRVSAC